MSYPYNVHGVTLVEELLGRSGGMGEDFIRRYSRKYKVETDSPNIGTWAVRVALFKALGVGIGTRYSVGAWDVDTGTGDAYYEQDNAYCTSIECDQSEVDGCQWEVKATWGPFDPRLNADSPLAMLAQINWDAEKFEDIADIDIDGNAIVNSAGDYFDPPVLRDKSRPILTIVRNEKLYSPHVALQFADKVNETPFFGFPPRTIKSEAPVAQQLWSPLVGDDGMFWEVHYEFHAADTWDKVLLDQGMRQRGTGGRRQIIVDGAPISSPVLLSSGSPVTPGGTPNYLVYRIYEELDFAYILGLGGEGDTY